MQAGAGALADGVQARQRRACVKVGGDAPHHVVSGGGDRDQLSLGIDPDVTQRRDDAGEQADFDLAHVKVDRGGAGGQQLGVDRQRDLVTRSELIDEALACSIEQVGAFAADRLGDQEPVGGRAAVRADDRGRGKLHHLEVRQRRASAIGEQHAAACRASWVRRARP